MSVSSQWWNVSWNPIRGCSHAGAGCKSCYAEAMARRFCGPGGHWEGFATSKGWTGRVELIDSRFEIPQRTRKHTVFFVASASDLFHERLSDDDIEMIFGLMPSKRHTFVILTKRIERAKRFFESVDWRLPGNVWLGVSVSTKREADKQISILLQTPAARADRTRVRATSNGCVLSVISVVRRASHFSRSNGDHFPAMDSRMFMQILYASAESGRNVNTWDFPSGSRLGSAIAPVPIRRSGQRIFACASSHGERGEYD